MASSRYQSRSAHFSLCSYDNITRKNSEAKGMTGDELDAVTAALVGRWLLLGKGEMIGGAEGIVLPKPD